MDLRVFQFFHSLVGASWLVDWLAIFFAKYIGYLMIAVLFLLIFLTYKQWKDRLYYIFLSLISFLVASGVIVEAARFFYYRPRPFKLLNFQPLIEQLATSSLPSNHAVVFFAATALMFYINKKYFWYFLVGASLMGIGRIFVGVHWPSDILAGALLGVATVLVFRKLI